LVDGLHKRPKLIDNFHVICVDPEVAAHHETEEELLLGFGSFSNVESDISQILYGLATDS
jgi:hypothetical protein